MALTGVSKNTSLQPISTVHAVAVVLRLSTVAAFDKLLDELISVDRVLLACSVERSWSMVTLQSRLLSS